MQLPAEPSGDIDERAYASAMHLLAITACTLCAALLAVAARCAVDGPTLVYEIIAAVLLAMFVAAVWLRGVAGRELTASARGDGRLPRHRTPVAPQSRPQWPRVNNDPTDLRHR
jgi:hypothetical protein